MKLKILLLSLLLITPAYADLDKAIESDKTLIDVVNSLKALAFEVESDRRMEHIR